MKRFVFFIYHTRLSWKVSWWLQRCALLPVRKEVVVSIPWIETLMALNESVNGCWSVCAAWHSDKLRTRLRRNLRPAGTGCSTAANCSDSDRHWMDGLFASDTCRPEVGTKIGTILQVLYQKYVYSGWVGWGARGRVGVRGDETADLSYTTEMFFTMYFIDWNY